MKFIKKAKKQKKSTKIKDWVVVVKGEYINAAINNHVDTVTKLKVIGYAIAGYCAFEYKNDAIGWIEAHIGRYKKERKK